MEQTYKILVVGSGGREHALALRLLESANVREVLVAPGNAGTRAAPAALSGKTLRNASGNPLEVALRERVELAVVGPEAPLCAGLVDALEGAGVPTFGPKQNAARLEGSKAFMKEFAARHGIPSGRFRVVRDLQAAENAIAEFSEPPVVKADGLCAGKGVVVAATHEQAREAAAGMLSGARFGDAGRTVVIEERILGAEASLHAICDGERFLLLPAAQDHKRIGDGDRGANTGGMGTYAPAPLITPELEGRIEREIFAPAMAGMRDEGMAFCGTLFAGLMITPEGNPLLLEFNVRFGDPETQVLMAATAGDLAEALRAAARGELAADAIYAAREHAVCVVLAAAGYPGEPRSGDVIEGIDAAEAVAGVRVIHAGTAMRDGRVVTAGGRVLGVTARGASLAEAHARAYQAVAELAFDGMQYRRDIAARALAPRIR
jgi:phosphoribosylamine---glycine ligase